MNFGFSFVFVLFFLAKPLLAHYSYGSPVSFTNWEWNSQGFANSNGAWTGNVNVGFTNLNTNPEFVDLNGDGLIDLMISFCDLVDSPSACYTYVMMNTGCSFIDQNTFSNDSYCSTVLENPTFLHLKKLKLLGTGDQRLQSMLSSYISKESLSFIEPIFAMEMITVENFYLLKEDDLRELKIPLGVRKELMTIISSHDRGKP